MSNDRPPIAIGDQYWNWTVIAQVRSHPQQGRQWLVRCICGVEKIKSSGELRFGLAKRCRNCAAKIRHWRPKRVTSPVGWVDEE